MAALVAERRKPIIKNLYQRLLALGKPTKTGLTAWMRKLVTILNVLGYDPFL